MHLHKFKNIMKSNNISIRFGEGRKMKLDHLRRPDLYYFVVDILRTESFSII